MRRILVLLALVAIGLVFAFKAINPPLTPLMILRTSGHVMEGRIPRLEREWTPLSAVPRCVVHAVLGAEDQNFFKHSGFDVQAIERAYQENEHGDRLVGGSTISQQTAKNVFLWPQRSWLRKGLEAFLTVLIELFWSKERILEIYLNVAEWGPGVYGVAAAARYHFHKPLQALTRAEAALLAAVLPNPLRWNPAQPTTFLEKRREWILAQMRYLEQQQPTLTLRSRNQHTDPHM